MNKTRLLKLAALLEKDAKTPTGVKFDLERWGKTERAKAFVKADCNTQACAIGLACISGIFKRDGLTFGLDEKDGTMFPVCQNQEPSWDYMNELTGWRAVQSFFGITRCEARKLFQSHKSRPSKGAKAEISVAKSIRTFVASSP